MSYKVSKVSNYNGQTEDKLNDYLISVDKDLSNLFRMSSPYYQFGSGTSYSILTISSTMYSWFTTVGGWNITNTLLYAGTGSTYIGLQPGTGIWMGDSAFATAIFSVDPTGSMKAHAGDIGGWYIGTTTLSSTNLVFDSGNELIRTQDYVSGALGHGWQIDKNVAEFQNIRARGKITTSVFEKAAISSIGGNFLVSDSDLLNADMTAADNSTMTVLGLTTFAINDILRIKDGTSDEWFTITGSTSALGLTVTRDQAGNYGANANPIWTKGTAVVNFGVSGEGLIFMTASETNNPYIDVVTHAGSPWSALTTRVRLGNLNGFLGYASALYGIAIGETDKYLKYDPTNGLQIAGVITALSGSVMNSSTALNTLSVSNLAASYVAGWAHGSDVTKINGGTIYTSSILADSISATAITLTKVAPTVLDYTNHTNIPTELSDINGTEGSKLTSIETGADVTASHTAANTLSVSSLAATSVAGWAAGGDTTKIDGGKIYTSSIVADSISATAITTVKIAANAITADKLSVSQLDSITVNTGSLTVDEYIQSSNYVAMTTGFRLSSSSGLEVNTGLIKGTLLTGSIGHQLFTADGTFTAPKGVTLVEVTLCGGGGGGAGAQDGSYGAGGGSGGISVIGIPYTVVAESNYTVTVGSGGAGGTGADGNDGEASTFDSLSAAGGTHGHFTVGGSGTGGIAPVTTLNGTAGNQNAGGAGGSISTGIAGNGGNCSGTSPYGGGGGGGATPFGAGGAGSNEHASGSNGSGYGSGGGGGGAGSGGSTTGGNGADGFVLVKW